MPASAHILIAEDDPQVRLPLQRFLENQGFWVEAVGTGEDAIEHIASGRYDLVITDLRMGETGGLEVLEYARRQPTPPEVIVITKYATVGTAVNAMRLGAFDYLVKPIRHEELLLIIEKALEKRRLMIEVQNLRRQVQHRFSFENIIAYSEAMLAVIKKAKRVALTNATLLIEGESGTGKELLAKAIHQHSRRAAGPYVAINCGALPESLLESELFGYKKGAFTGAVSDKPGLIEEANGGTLFLDEIGEMPLSVQVKLLRVLQEGEIRRVGDVQLRRVDVRVIAATNRDLGRLVEQGRFREDLYYRLNVIPIRIPPLRERKEDIPPLVKHFLAKFSEELRHPVKEITPEAMEALLRYDWPGNVRELENTIERCVILSHDDVIGPEDLPEWARREQPAPPMAAEAAHDGQAVSWGQICPEWTLAELERWYILETLRRYAYNQSQAARHLGIGRNTLWKKLKQYGIRIHRTV
ncbi:MAG: sigma-54 dependent transcriptional regulator [Bacteroidetes bacterium]|nr:sigma-54 dependent transcriptional regulator [Rhodothermia bacterium]MCS7154221.1 sigma-54 dependent transcriptional regulator [Bacteroidota bacterium]MCX7906743.1 sigma-54 dependent transcriptional regulator [Bacteroidota bacterium]MDW8136977.1 sigma-54 dependent transcriptional regulator [Bacteroidota bacterium]MDW8285152.1 sigma-54 dependent transcriptional regulator [Bacteroidota bacterium]